MTEQWFSVLCWHLLNWYGWQRTFTAFSIYFHLGLPCWWWIIIIKVYWLFLGMGIQISETGNFKINNPLAPLSHTLHYMFLFLLLTSHFPQLSVGCYSLCFFPVYNTDTCIRCLCNQCCEFWKPSNLIFLGTQVKCACLLFNDILFHSGTGFNSGRRVRNIRFCLRSCLHYPFPKEWARHALSATYIIFFRGTILSFLHNKFGICWKGDSTYNYQNLAYCAK